MIDVEDLREDQRRDGEIDVAQPRREIGDESGDPAGADEPVEERQPQIGRPTVSSAAAAPYMPSPKNAEWPNDTMPV